MPSTSKFSKRMPFTVEQQGYYTCLNNVCMDYVLTADHGKISDADHQSAIYVKSHFCVNKWNL